MLSSLYIKNYAIISELEISFTDGLNIITGETGSGKTLLIKAIQILMGSRFSKEMIRTGEDKIIIKGVFLDQSKKLAIKRIYNRNGNSKTFINNDVVNQKELHKITSSLIDIHGQHDHQNILDSNNHLLYLDRLLLYLYHYLYH